MKEGVSTRDKIIDAAFSFYRKPVFTNISLSQIAQKVGISKAAIFKHFPSKASLKQALFERMFDGIAEVMRRMLGCYRNGKRIEAMSEAVDFLVNHREYVMYFQSQQCIVDEGVFVRELRKRSIRVFDSLFTRDGSIKDIDLYVPASTSERRFLFLRSSVSTRSIRMYRDLRTPPLLPIRSHG